MKPDGAVARRRDYEVRPIEHRQAVALVSAHHYARGCSNTGITHGLFRTRDGALVGAAVWLPPTRVCAESVSKESWRNVLSLSRLVILPDEPQNCATLFLARSTRLLPTRWTHLVTFADESQNHRGTIYRAGGWTELGRTRPEARWVDASGRQVARKAGRRSRTAQEMVALGLRLEGRFAKWKFTKTRSL